MKTAVIILIAIWLSFAFCFYIALVGLYIGDKRKTDITVDWKECSMTPSTRDELPKLMCVGDTQYSSLYLGLRKPWTMLWWPDNPEENDSDVIGFQDTDKLVDPQQVPTKVVYKGKTPEATIPSGKAGAGICLCASFLVTVLVTWAVIKTTKK